MSMMIIHSKDDNDAHDDDSPPPGGGDQSLHHDGSEMTSSSGHYPGSRPTAATDESERGFGKRKDRESVASLGQETDAAAGEESVGEGTEEPPTKNQRKDKATKAKTMMSADLYRSMTAMVALILKTKVG